MSAGADVAVQVMFKKEAVAALKQLTSDAIRNALYRAKDRIYDLAQKYTPVVTGRLAASFDMAFTPRSLVMKWDAQDPKSGFHYAKVVEEGRSGYKPFPGRFYAEATKYEARDIVTEELIRELSNIGTVGI
jgi:hypothetical protein